MNENSVLSVRNPLRVLVADDDDDLRDLLALRFEALGCAVEQAPDGDEALRRIESGPIDLLVTDWQMPGIDGMELVRRARSARRNESHLHVAMMTARGDDDALRQALDAGVDDFLFKPVEPMHLELALESARRNRLLHPRLQRRNTLLTAAHERTRVALEKVRQDLDAATALHERLLPDRERMGGFVLHHLYRPAALLGGDTIGVTALREGGLLFFVIDVKGHGVPAALDSFHLHHRIKQLRPTRPKDLGATIATINAEICARGDESYATVVCGLLHPERGEGWIVCAGHPPPLIGLGREVRFLEEARAMPVGWFERGDFAPLRFDFPQGARLLLYSDGVTECPDAQGREFGAARLANTLTYNAGRPLLQVVRAIELGLLERRTADGFEDDISLLAIEHVMTEDC